MKNKPQYVNVLGVRINIKYEDLTEDHIFGDADYQEKVIRLDSSLEGDMLKKYLRHEKMHIALGLSGISEFLSSELEESICVLMETVKL